ncbi:unnamed protein product [Thelazia callipaeda]|uniref:ANK_REP_REGION domain-containing protein n=1 Tax=Thelazia callipaeda TaxID=103827 RepID=A0A0N5CUR3_THECL|nr:unnamed protein product [Thelazia callipaeda]
MTDDLKIFTNLASLQEKSMLHLAIANDRVAVTQLLLSLGADLQQITMKGRSLLHIAVINDAAKCLMFLLTSFREKEKYKGREDGWIPTTKFIMHCDSNGENLLHLACRLRRNRCLKADHTVKQCGWLTLEEMLQQCNHNKQTPIHVACLSKSVVTVNFLLTSHLNKFLTKICKLKESHFIANTLRDVSVRTLLWRIERGTILHELTAMKCNSAYSFDKHLSSSLNLLKLDVYDECRRVFHTLSIFNNKKWAILKQSKKFKLVDPIFHTALHHAALWGRLLQIKILLKCGASLKEQDEYGATPMHHAAIRGHAETLKLLYKANKFKDEIVTNSGHNAFMWAAMHGFDSSIRTMLDTNPAISREDYDRNGCTALHLAANYDHVGVVSTLLAFNWNLEKQNKFGQTPLLLAAKNGCSATVRRLLRAGANYAVEDKSKNNVLHLVADSDSKQETLLELLNFTNNSTVINSRNNMGKTPLHIAAECNSVQCIRCLFEYGADPLVKDYRGWDPFMVAIQRGCWSTIIVMIKSNLLDFRIFHPVHFICVLHNLKSELVIVIIFFRNPSSSTCYSTVNRFTTLSLALEMKNFILASFLEANSENEIKDVAARKSNFLLDHILLNKSIKKTAERFIQ